MYANHLHKTVLIYKYFKIIIIVTKRKRLMKPIANFLMGGNYTANSCLISFGCGGGGDHWLKLFLSTFSKYHFRAFFFPFTDFQNNKH